MELRLYQAEQIKRVIRELKERALALLASAVGSGKTTVSKIIINEVIKSEVLGIKKVIISSPFLTIAKDFESAEDDEIWSAPSHPHYNASSYIIGGNSIKLIDDDSTREMKRVLKASSYDPRSFSHASLARIESMIDDPAVTFADTLLVIDEAHHCFHDDEDDSVGGTILGKVVNRAVEKGAKVLYLTATPYRTEGRRTIPIVDTGVCNPIVRTIGEQIRDGFSPAIDVEYIHIKGDYDFLVNKYKHEPTIVDGPFVIFSKPKQGRVYAEFVYDQWVKEGCPKGIIVLPQGESVKTAEMVKSYFIERGFPVGINRGRNVPSILDAVGDKVSDRERIIKEIQDDKRLHGRKYDLVIGCRRFDEGTDVPSASHVYMIGVPGNVRIFHQRAGRILRDKKSVVGYSEWFGDAWLNKAKAVFFVPLFSKVDKLGSQVARQLLHCIFAGENFQAYCDFASTSIELKKALETHLTDAVGKHVGEIEEALKAIDSFMMFEGINQSQRITDLTIAVKEFCEKALEGVTDPVEKLAIQTAIVENLSCVSIEEVKKLAEGVIKKVVTASSKISKEDPGIILRPLDSVIQKEMGLAFQLLISTFGRKKIAFKSEGYVDRVLVSLTGEDLSHWTKACEFLYDNEELSNKMCRKVCEWMKAHENRVPRARGGDDIETVYGVWVCNKRQIQKNSNKVGLFFESDQRIAEDSGYTDLFETWDSETFNNNMCRDLCEWMKSHNNKEPSMTSEDEDEKKFRIWLSTKKQDIKGSTGTQFHMSNIEIAKSYGYPNLFEPRDLEELSNDTCHKLCLWIKSNGKNPSQMSEEKEEKFLGLWLSCMRKAKKNSEKSHRIIYPSNQKILESYGFSRLFDIDDPEQISNDRCTEICEWMKEHQNKVPSTTSKDSTEKKHGRFVSSMRKVKGKKHAIGQMIFYASNQAIAEQYGYSTIFDIIDKEKISNEFCHKVCQWVKINGRSPNKRSSNKEESSYGNWVSHMKSKTYESNHVITTFYGYPNLLKGPSK